MNSTKMLWPFFVLACTIVAASHGTGPFEFQSGINSTRVETPTRATLVRNAVVHTVHESNPSAEAFAFDATGRIVAVGTERAVRSALKKQKIKRFATIDMKGRFVLPGFQDTHVHIPEAGTNSLEAVWCYLPQYESLARYVRLLSKCNRRMAGTGWLRAVGATLYSLNGLAGSPLDALDAAVRNRPVIVLDDLGHVVWLNSRGVRVADVDVSADPTGGFLGRDARGRFNGLLFENAQQKARDAAQLPLDRVYDGLLMAMRQAVSNGITTISDAGGFWTRPNGLKAWTRALKNGKIPVRAKNALYVYPDMPFDSQMASLNSLYSNDKADQVVFNTAKIYVDGILDAGSALLLDRYRKPILRDYPKGFPYFSDRALKKYVNALVKAGFQIHFHAVGDAAVRKALDAIEAAPGGKRSRSRITHAYLVNVKDRPRFQKFGVTADFQMTTSRTYERELSRLLGRTRASSILPTRELLSANAVTTLSSDWDADTLSPFKSLHSALTRGRDSVRSVRDAIRMKTLDAAYALNHEAVTGSIERGKWADFIVVDANLLKIRRRQISNVRVLQTFVNGKRVYRN